MEPNKASCFWTIHVNDCEKYLCISLPVLPYYIFFLLPYLSIWRNSWSHQSLQGCLSWQPIPICGRQRSKIWRCISAFPKALRLIAELFVCMNMLNSTWLRNVLQNAVMLKMHENGWKVLIMLFQLLASCILLQTHVVLATVSDGPSGTNQLCFPGQVASYKKAPWCPWISMNSISSLIFCWHAMQGSCKLYLG